MSFLKATAALLLTSLLPFVASAPAARGAQPDYIPNQYVVQVKPSVDLSTFESHISWVNSIHARDANVERRLDLPGLDKKIVSDNFKAYTGKFDDATIKLIKANPDVLRVEQDRWVYPHDFEAYEPETLWPAQSPNSLEGRSLLKRGLVQQTNAIWNLRAVSQKPPATQSTSYIFDSTAAQGTWAYVVDSGINVGHQDFKGRASLGYNAFPSKPNADTMGHGTHVAGTIGSYTYGVAKLTNLISVKIFDDAGSATSVIMDGYNWAVNDIKANNRVGKAVISMSLGGGKVQSFNDLIKAAYDSGITTVVAAGNDNVDAANTSPASAPEAITVAAMDQNYAKASFSNYGAVVDLWAPGVNILSTYIGSNTATATLAGTSMACPHVTGLALYFMSIYGVMPSGQLAYNMVRVSNKNAISGVPSGTVNALAYNDDGV